MQKIALIPFILISIMLFSCKNGEDPKTELTEETTSEGLDSEDGNSLTNSQNAEAMVEGKDESNMNAAQFNVQKLLESCVKKDYAAASKLIMYRGADQSRMGKDSFNYSDPKEANTVKVTCEVINTWLGSSKSYEFISYKEEQTEYGQQLVVEVLFSKQKIGIDRHFFYLMNSPKGMIVVNMI